jgi:pilus assembly protein CpaE
MNVWIACETPALGARLEQSLARLGVTTTLHPLAACERWDASSLGAAPPQVVVIAVNRVFPPHLELIKRTRRVFSGTLVASAIVHHHAIVIDAIRAGADDFLDLAGDVLTELQALVGRSRDAARPSSAAKRLIAVAPAADASDAVFLAANLAVALASREGRCELLDFHLRGGDLASLLGLAPRHTLADLANLRGEIDRAMVEQAMVTHASGVRLLAGPPPFSGAAIPIPALQRILTLARTTASLLVLTASEVEDLVRINALAATDQLVLTTRLDLISLARTKHCVAWLKSLGAAVPSLRVAALAAGRRAEVPAKEVARVLSDVQVDCIPDDQLAYLASINLGEPLVTHAPKSPAAGAIAALASEILHGPAAAQSAAPRRTANWLAACLPRKRTGPATALPAALGST